jgi:hypothetical protein
LLNTTLGLCYCANKPPVLVIFDTSPLCSARHRCAAGWTGFLDLFLGHYGIEVEEENILLFVGIIPIAIDVWFKYWIFIGEGNRTCIRAALPAADCSSSSNRSTSRSSKQMQ